MKTISQAEVTLADPRFGEGALELLEASYASATSGGQRECFCCCRLWSPDRALAAVLVAEIIQGGEGALVAAHQTAAPRSPSPA